MKQYFRNIWLFLHVRWLWTRKDNTDEGILSTLYPRKYICYKDGWGPWSFLPMYLLNYGIACIVLGIGVQPISRWAGERASHEPWRTLRNWLDELDARHTADSGPLLWGSKPAPPLTRYIATGFWLGVLLFIIF